MDNRLNELRRKISTLRIDMLEMEASIRDQVNDDRDCTESALRLMAVRRELTAMVAEWARLGGKESLPAIHERLRQTYRPDRRPMTQAKKKTEQKTEQKVAPKVQPKAGKKVAKRRLLAWG